MGIKRERREFLCSTVGAVLFTLSGCTISEDGNETGNDGASQSGKTEPETSPTAPSPDVELRIDDLLVENFDGVIHCLRITVALDREQILDKRVNIPAASGLVFGDVASPTSTYEVEAARPDGPTESFDWRVGECPQEGDDMNGSVIIRDGKLSFDRNSCDAESVGYELTYYQPDDYIGCE